MDMMQKFMADSVVSLFKLFFALFVFAKAMLMGAA